MAIFHCYVSSPEGTQFHQPKPGNVFWDWLSHIIPDWNVVETTNGEKPNEAAGAVPQHVHVGDCHVPAGILQQPRKMHRFSLILLQQKRW